MGNIELRPEHLEELKRIGQRVREIAGETGTMIDVYVHNPKDTDNCAMTVTVRETDHGKYDKRNFILESYWEKDFTGFTWMRVNGHTTYEAAFGSDKDSDTLICDIFEEKRHPDWVYEEVSA